MKAILNKLFEFQELSHEEAREVLHQFAGGNVNPAQMAAFLTAYRMRPVTVAELRGFRQALLELCLAVDLEGRETIDLCGTGGDGKDTFNISTLTSFVVAGAGYPVTKHGNYGVSSACGSSNVMEHLGYRFTNDAETLLRQLDRAGICFLHAPLFHPAMKAVAPVRRQLGIKTFFNMLGPLVNPARPKAQLTGVFNLELARLYKYILQQEGLSYAIVHSLDGYDEISLTGPYRCITPTRDEVVAPEERGFSRLDPISLHGGTTVPEAAAIFMEVLNGKGSPAQESAVLANAGLAIQTAAPTTKLADATEEARTSLHSGKALKAFQLLIETSAQ